jgi:hypothetical protein
MQVMCLGAVHIIHVLILYYHIIILNYACVQTLLYYACVQTLLIRRWPLLEPIEFQSPTLASQLEQGPGRCEWGPQRTSGDRPDGG